MKGGVGGDVAAAPAGPPPSPSLEWKFSQVFGERTAGEEVQEGNSVIAALEFLLLLDPCSFLVSVYILGFAYRILICYLVVNCVKYSLLNV